MPGLSTSNNTVWCDDISYINFQSYSLDPSPYSNFIHLALLEDADPFIPPGTVPLVVHPDWILAAWSVDRNGTVDGTRIPALQVSAILETVLTEANASLAHHLGTNPSLDVQRVFPNIKTRSSCRDHLLRGRRGAHPGSVETSNVGSLYVPEDADGIAP